MTTMIGIEEKMRRSFAGAFSIVFMANGMKGFPIIKSVMK